MDKMKKIFFLVFFSFCWWLNAAIINVPADYETIQAGLNVATEDDSVLVANGVYYENIVWPAVNGIKLIGESEENLNGIIDTTTVITGFTIQNGYAQGDYSASSGGGFFFYESNPNIENVTISNNSASSYGGGIFCRYSDPSFINVTISNNSAGSGGGIYCYRYSDPSFVNVTISNNSASSYGGGIYWYRQSDQS